MLVGARDVVAIPAHADQDVAAYPVRPPEEILIVAADDGRQAVLAAEKIDGRRFAVILSADDRLTIALVPKSAQPVLCGLELLATR